MQLRVFSITLNNQLPIFFTTVPLRLSENRESRFAKASRRTDTRYDMAERSFVKEVEKLRLGQGEVFNGEGILAVTKALLESGVSYVAGYQGAPISHLMDVLADAQDILTEYGIRFENSASEATAAATLSASVHY